MLDRWTGRIEKRRRTDCEALLQAIAAARADNKPRAVYADWLEARGDSRSAFLRLRQTLSGPSVPVRRESLLSQTFSPRRTCV
jgi:uncharacterized protein (TIGR02996 family)